MFNKNRQLGIVIAVICIGLDFWSKQTILHTIEDAEIEVIPGLFNLTLAFNRGVSFSMFANLPAWELPYILAAISIAASGLFIYFMKPDIDKCALWGFALMLGGALGNMIDRFRFGAVVDFLHVYYENWHFPAFNVADSCISIGVAFIVLSAILEFLKERKQKCKN